MFHRPLSLFRVLAIAEAITWTLLIAALIVRAAGGWAPGVTIAGGIHGFVFLSFGATVVLVAKNNRWRIGPTIVVLASAIVPYATIPAEVWLHRRGMLAGAWRHEATDDPRDATWHDRLMRALLRRPALLGALVVAAVVVIFGALLVIGPPGGRA